MAQHRVVAAVETARISAKNHFDYAHTRFAGGHRTRRSTR